MKNGGGVADKNLSIFFGVALFSYHARPQRGLLIVSPAATQCLDQCHIGGELLSCDLQCRVVRGVGVGLGGDHVEVGDDARFILVGGETQRFVCRRLGLQLQLRLVREGGEGGELILDLLQSLQAELPILRDRLLVSVSVLRDQGTACAGIEQRFRQ